MVKMSSHAIYPLSENKFSWKPVCICNLYFLLRLLGKTLISFYFSYGDGQLFWGGPLGMCLFVSFQSVFLLPPLLSVITA